MEGDVIVLQDIYTFDFGMGIDEEGRFLGRLKSTGIRPTFSERLADHGIAARAGAVRARAVRRARSGAPMSALDLPRHRCWPRPRTAPRSSSSRC